MYFKEEDYEIFNEEYVTLNTQEIREKRKEVQTKLLEINLDIEESLKEKYDLNTHKRQQNKTSLIYPCEFNHGRVDWIGIRYGRNENDINCLNQNREYGDTYLGFQKYTCFQVDIAKEGIEMGIFHSVPNDSIDRLYVREQLDNDNNDEFKEKLINEIKNIQGYGYEFEVNWFDKITNSWKNETFTFDRYNKEDVGNKFIEFYQNNCIDGRYSSILYLYPKKDERISDKEKIEEEIFKNIKKLFSLYKVLCWSPKKSN